MTKDWLKGYLAGIIAVRRNALEGSPAPVLTQALIELDALIEAIEAMDEDFVALGRAEIAKLRDGSEVAER